MCGRSEQEGAHGPSQARLLRESPGLLAEVTLTFSKAGPVTMLVPVSAILLGVGILHERLSLAQIGGMLLVGMGLVALDGRVLRRLRQAA